MIGVDLIPSQHRLARQRRRHLARWGVAIGAVAACGAIPITLGLSKHARAMELGVEEKSNQAQLASARKELALLTRQSNEIRRQIERASALRGKRSWSALIAMIGRVAPQEVWLTAFATDPVQPGGNSRRGRVLGGGAKENAAAADHVTIDAPRRLILQGYAANHAALYQLMGGLKNTGVFSSVTLRDAARENVWRGVQLTFELFRFELTCEW